MRYLKFMTKDHSYPQFGNKHLFDPLVSAKKLFEYQKQRGRVPEGPPPSKVILCYQNSLMERVVENFKGHFGIGTFRQLYALQSYPGVSIGRFGIGSPSVAAKTEMLIAWGVKHFISIGTAGAISPDLNVGDLVGCNKALRDEGTSHHYLPAGRYTHPTDHGAFASKFERVGATWTIDALFRHTKEEVIAYQKEGILTVEMEASALFAVAAVHKVSMGTGFVISDLVFGDEWEVQMREEPVEKGLDKLLEMALSG